MMRRLLFLLLALSTPAIAACHAVSPAGAGTHSGADWNNSFAGLPATLVRGDIYYLADGNYGTSLSVTTAASGTTTIEIRKAQSYDNGSSCPTSIAAGWNTSTMGSGQAVWSQTAAGGNSFVNLGSGGYYIFNGNGNNAGTAEVGCGGVQANPPANMLGAAPNPAACGIKIDASTCTSTANNGCDGGNGEMHGGGPGIVWESVEWKGQGLNSNGNNNSETYFWFASGGSLSGVNISHSYLHNASTTYFTVVAGGWQGGSFDHNYGWGIFDGSVNHGEAIQLQGSNGTTTKNLIHHNIFRDQQTNGDVVAVISGTQTYDFYDNADVCSAGGTSTTCRHNDGVIGCFNTQTCSNVNVYNNTFSFPSSCGWNISGGPSTMTVKNNLFFNCGSVGMTGGTVTVDYNSYLNSSQSAVGAHDLSATGAANPFTSVGTGNVTLTTDSPNYNNRTSLGSPYDTLDLYGNAFTTDRGAAQFIPPPTFTTWYIRPDGGTRWDPTHTSGQCDGKHDAAYPGTGTNQPCAFNDPRWLWDNQNFGNYPNWIVQGGDTVILRANTAGAAWRVGFTGNGSSTDPWCFGGNGPFNCVMPPIPGGPTGHPTLLLGENYQSCNTTRTMITVNGPRVQQIPNVAKTTKLWGGHGAFVVVNATGTGDVQVKCLDVSSFNPACQLQGSPQPNPCNKNIGSLDDYASDAIETSNQSGNIVFQDLYVHGMNSRGIHGQQGIGSITANRVWISIIPQTGYDFDDSSASGTGAFSLTNSIIEASGCQQLASPPNYPPLSDAQLMNDIGVCYSQGSGNVIGDGIGTPANSGFPVNMDSDVFQWNTQDGEDFGHMDTGTFPFSLTNSVSQHNMGQTFKNGWSFSPVTYLNNIAMADCQRFASGNALPGNPPALVNQFNVDPCRAGDNFSINFQANTQMTIANNTIVGYAPTFFDYKCVNNNANCPGAVWNLNNNIILAYVNPNVNSGQAPADFCGPGADASSSCNNAIGLVGTINRQNNIYFNVRNCHANQQTPGSINFTSTGEQCTSPLLVNQPASPMAAFNSLDNFNYNPTSTSPVLKAGVGYTGILSTDYAGNAQTTPPVIGALVLSGSTPPPTVTSISATPNPGAVLVGSTLQMTCTATYSDFSTGPCPTPGWTGTNAHSTISSTGLVTGVSAGSDTITASSSGFTSNATVNVSALPIVATPTASPVPGTYNSTQTVTLTDATGGATICYRTDGPAPTAPTPGTCGAGSLTYSTPLTVSATTTILALGTESGFTNSSTATFAYTITSSPPATTVTGTFTVTGQYTTPH